MWLYVFTYIRWWTFTICLACSHIFDLIVDHELLVPPKNLQKHFCYFLNLPLATCSFFFLFWGFHFSLQLLFFSYICPLLAQSFGTCQWHKVAAYRDLKKKNQWIEWITCREGQNNHASPKCYSSLSADCPLSNRSNWLNPATWATLTESSTSVSSLKSPHDKDMPLHCIYATFAQWYKPKRGRERMEIETVKSGRWFTGKNSWEFHTCILSSISKNSADWNTQKKKIMKHIFQDATWLNFDFQTPNTFSSTTAQSGL